ncbi:MAG: hypothetical protein C4523_11980 [Myxococcales bacterium]|nr:MAG: hypothetical protein C4523_11980 [Myxococcales bacterium]
MTAVLFAALLLPGMAEANSVETLPEGIFAIGLKWGFKWATEQFGNDFGTGTTSIVQDYNITITGADLDPTRFTTDDILGTLDVTYDSYGMEFSITTAYGITDNLSVMMIIPIQYTHNEFNVELLGSNMYLQRDAEGNPVIPVNETLAPALGLTETMNTQDFFDILSCETGGQICQFRYKPIKNWSRWGLGEVITGLRYKFFDNQKWRQGITLFNKWPTGRHKQTDDLFDINFGDQNWDVGFWYGVDYMPIQDLMFNVSGGYTEQLPFVRQKRIWGRNIDPDTGKERGAIPVAEYWKKIPTHIDYGGNWDLYWGFTWIPRWVPFLNFSNEFYFFWKYHDNYWAEEAPQDPNGNPWTPDFRAMEWGTQTSAIEMTNAIGFNTIGWVQRGEFPVPLQFAVGYTVGIAGKHFERQNSVWLSLDLIGSIYMFEEAVATEEDKELEDFKLPARAATDPDAPAGALAEERESEKERKLREAGEWQNSFGKVRKYGW